MAIRIRVLAGSFALGVSAWLLSGTAAQATPLSGGHAIAHVSAISLSSGPGGETQSPTPTPTNTQTPPSSPPVTSPAPPSPSITPTATATASPTATPSGGANTGGGGSVGGGGNLPLAAGGAAIALTSAGIGLLAFRRWRKTRLPTA